ncbi:MAG: thiamine-phosphate kinase [Alphaproteobacteria bacterium]|nr:thiamine-phosphate kinase [Alphaproteobacteria bacterium]
MVKQSRRKPDEFEIIARFFRPLATGEKGALRLLDDAAILALPPKRRLVATTDCLVAGVHFLADAKPEDIAPKLLRVNLSDLAAMGAEPRWYLLTAAFSKRVDAEWIGRFARTLKREQNIFGITLVGGDTVATPGPACFTVTALGVVQAGKELHRGGAKPGDDIYVSGTIGDGVLGLHVLQNRLSLPGRYARALKARYHRPSPRIALGTGLIGLAHAAIDVSDGLVADLGHICETANVSAQIESDRIPLSPAGRTAVKANSGLMRTILTGGDDYELAFAAPPEKSGRIHTLARKLGIPIAKIGRIVLPKRGQSLVRVMDRAGRAIPLERAGWRHF